MKFKLQILFIFLLSVFCHAQNVHPTAIDSLVDASIGIDTDSILKSPVTTQNTVFPKNFRDHFRDKYKSKEYDYSLVKPRESLWERITNYLHNLLRRLFGSGKNANRYTELVLRLGAVLLIFALIYFIIRYLVSKDGKLFFSRKNRKTEIPVADLHENIHEINFAEKIAEFERKKDYRSAIRYRFLQVLKSLSDKKLINWNPEKTNTDYAAELQDDSIKNNFTELVRIFDYVWYGEFSISENDYRYFVSKFQNSAVK